MTCTTMTTNPCPNCVVNERAVAPQWAGNLLILKADSMITSE